MIPYYYYSKIGIISERGNAYSINQLCEMFHVDPETVMGWVKDGKLDADFNERLNCKETIMLKNTIEEYKSHIEFLEKQLDLLN